MQCKEVVHYGKTCSVKSDGVKKTAAEWKIIWLKKFDQITAKEKICDDRRNCMRKIIDDYLENVSSAPCYVQPYKLLEYLKIAGRFQINALGYFYERVAISAKHVEIIRTFSDESDQYTSEPSETPDSLSGQNGTIDYADNRKIDTLFEIKTVEVSSKETPFLAKEERVFLLEKLKLEINSRNLSEKTLDNYLRAATRFINWLTPEISKDWHSAFKQHLVWLREEKKLAANTINTYAASIVFFMEEVLEVKPGEDLFIRMKTGRSLPRVHSLQQITSIINASSNSILRPDPELSNQTPSYSHVDLRMRTETGRGLHVKTCRYRSGPESCMDKKGKR
jgi:hypothetical protein